MANAARGGHGFKANGRDLTLEYDVEALCLLEGLHPGKLALTVLQEALSRPTITRIRQLVWAGLQLHHPEGKALGFDLKAAGELMRAPEIDGLGGLVELVKDGFQASYPTAEAAEGAADPQPTPQPAADGTGPGSTAFG